jgi:hypothetical protein
MWKRQIGPWTRGGRNLAISLVFLFLNSACSELRSATSTPRFVPKSLTISWLRTTRKARW